MPRCAARTAGTVLRARSKPMTFASPIAKLNLLNAKRKAIHARQTRPGVSVALNQNTFGIEASGPVPPGGGAMAAFYGKVSVPTGAPIYISYLGGTGYDDARTLTRTGDPERLVISGTTYSANFPVSGGGSAMDSSCGPPCNSDTFDSYLRGAVRRLARAKYPPTLAATTGTYPVGWRAMAAPQQSFTCIKADRAIQAISPWSTRFKHPQRCGGRHVQHLSIGRQRA